jgi:hypothetical protein
MQSESRTPHMVIVISNKREAITYGDVIICPRRSLGRVVVGVEHTEGVSSGHQPVRNRVPQASLLVEVRNVELTRVRVVERGDGQLLIWNRGIVNLQMKRAGSLPNREDRLGEERVLIHFRTNPQSESNQDAELARLGVDGQ